MEAKKCEPVVTDYLNLCLSDLKIHKLDLHSSCFN